MAIRDQSYTRYDGPMREEHSWAIIGWTGFRTYWRFWRTKLTLFVVWLVPVIFGLLIIAEAALMDAAPMLGEEMQGGPSHVGISFFLGIQLYALALVYIARGCSIISDDLRHQTLQLYFSKPITRLDYAAGKVTTLVLLGLVAVVIPAVMLAGLRTAFYAQTDMLVDIVILHMQGALLLALIVALLSSLVVGLSSLTSRSGYAVLAWIGLLIVPVIIQVIVGVTTDGSPWLRMLSISGIVGLAGDALMGGADVMPAEIPRVVPFFAIFGLIGAGLGALYWRINRIDGVA